jgi:hypothetical protein
MCIKINIKDKQMRKISVLGSITFSMLVSCAATGQEMPVGALVDTVDCTLNDGVTMAQAVEWARNLPREGMQPNVEFYRENILGSSNYKADYDFQIGSYFDSYSQLVATVASNLALPANRTRPGQRATDLYTCDTGTQRIVENRAVPNGGTFTGPVTLMSTFLCRINDDSTPADVWEFLVGVNDNYRAEGETSIVQLHTRAVGPVQNRGNGDFVGIAVVPSTPEAWGARMDMPRDGFSPFEGVELPMICNYPSLWLTHAVHRSGPPQ